MVKRTRAELPYETYERVTGKKWTSGKAADVTKLLGQYGIKAPAGSEQANNELQRALKRGLPEEKPAKPVVAKLLGGPDAKIGAAPPPKGPTMQATPLAEIAREAVSEGDLARLGTALKDRVMPDEMPHLPLHTREFLYTLFGRNEPITEKDLYPSEIRQLRDVLDKNPAGVRSNAISSASALTRNSSNACSCRS